MSNGGGGRDKESKKIDDGEGGMYQGRGKERRKKIRIFLLKKKRYEDQLRSKLEQQPFPGNVPESLLGILTMRNKSASARIPL